MRSIQNFCTCLFLVTFDILFCWVTFAFIVSLSRLLSCYTVSILCLLFHCHIWYLVMLCHVCYLVILARLFVVSLPRLLTYAIVCCVILFHFCIYCFIVAFAILLHCVTFTFVASLSHLLSCYTVSLLPHEVTFCCRELCDMTFSRLQLWALLMQTATSFRSVLPPIVH